MENYKIIKIATQQQEKRIKQINSLNKQGKMLKMKMIGLKNIPEHNKSKIKFKSWFIPSII